MLKARKFNSLMMSANLSTFCPKDIFCSAHYRVALCPSFYLRRRWSYEMIFTISKTPSQSKIQDEEERGNNILSSTASLFPGEGKLLLKHTHSNSRPKSRDG
jgi:hypothetical protein